MFARARAATIALTFPLVVASGGRYLQTQSGAPFAICGDSAWALTTALDAVDVEQYLATRKAQGFNTLVMQASSPVIYKSASIVSTVATAKGAGGALPFLKNTSGTTWTGVFANHDADFSTPNDTYWNWVIYVLGRCQAYGFAVILDWIYFGFNQGVGDGWIQDIANAANTQSVMLTFGGYIVAKCVAAGLVNLIYSFGTDTFPSAAETIARINKFNDGWVAGGGTALAAGHYQRSSDSMDDADFSSRITVNGVYPGQGSSGSHAPTYRRCLTAYAKSPAKPVFCLEATYEGEGSRTRENCRFYGWNALFASKAGYVFGNNPVWMFDVGWQTSLTSNGALDASKMFAFWQSLPAWQLMVPDGQESIGTLVTAGGGGTQTLGSVGSVDLTDGLDHVVACCSPDGATLVAYVPNTHTGTVTIDMTKMRGTTVQRWFDPTNATYQSAGANLPNTGTHAFTVPGTNSDGASDWVLRLDA